jgi:LytS/YehU family sensor histidine kinase
MDAPCSSVDLFVETKSCAKRQVWVGLFTGAVSGLFRWFLGSGDALAMAAAGALVVLGLFEAVVKRLSPKAEPSPGLAVVAGGLATFIQSMILYVVMASTHSPEYGWRLTFIGRWWVLLIYKV